MKKYLILLLTTICAFSFIFMTNDKYNRSIKTLEIITVEATEVVDKIIATGFLEDKNSTKIEYKIPLQINKIFVKTGDYVKKGDKLFSIDKENTVNYLLSNASVLSLNSSLDYNAITSLPSDINSPVNGYISEVNFKEGDIYDTLNPIMTISEQKNIMAVVSISEENLPKVKIGQTAHMYCKGLTDKKINGEVSYIHNNAKQTYLSNGNKETVIDVEIKITDNLVLKTGYSVSATIILDKSKKTIIPYTAISQDEQGEYIYVVNGGYAERVNIKTLKDYKVGSAVTSNHQNIMVVLNSNSLNSKKVRLVD